MKVLIVEGEKDLSGSIATYLKRENYLCDTAYSVVKGLEKIKVIDYDCIVLDGILTEGSGSLFLKELHSHCGESGLIVISAKDSPDDRVAGLNMGADDYLVKPLAFSELNARITAVIRRKRFNGQNRIVIGELVIDLVAKTLAANKKEVDLTRREFDLLVLLVSHKNQVISTQAIAEKISGEAGEPYKNFEFVYSHIRNLKRKLAASGCPECIKSVHRLGYRFTD